MQVNNDPNDRVVELVEQRRVSEERKSSNQVPTRPLFRRFKLRSAVTFSTSVDSQSSTWSLEMQLREAYVQESI